MFKNYLTKQINAYDKKLWSGKLNKQENYRLKILADLTKGKTLDIGYAQHPNKFLKKAYGIDIEKVKKPKNYKETKIVDLNKEPIPYNNKTFNTIIASDIIEHLENPTKFLKEIHRTLKNHGELILCTPHANYWGMIIRNMFLRNIKDTDQKYHLSNWTIIDMKRLLKINKFKIKKIQGTVMPIPIIRTNIPMTKSPFLSLAVIYRCKK